MVPDCQPDCTADQPSIFLDILCEVEDKIAK